MKFLLAICIMGACAFGHAQDQGESALLLASGSSATATFVRGAAANTATTTASAAAITVASGDLIFVASKTQNNNAGGASVVFSSTGITCTWAHTTALDNFAAGTFTTAVGWCVVASSGSMTNTVTWSGLAGSGFTDISVAEMHSSSGFQSTPLDVTAQTATASGTTCATGPTSTTTNANDLVVAVCENFNAAQTYGTATGYTLQSTSSRNTVGYYWKSISATAAQSFSTTVASDQSTAVLVALKMN